MAEIINFSPYQQLKQHQFVKTSTLINDLLHYTQKIRCQNKLSIAEIMEDYHKNRSIPYESLKLQNAQYFSVSSKIQKEYNGSIESDQIQLQQYNANQKSLENWIPYLEQLVSSHDNKVKQIEQLAQIIVQLCTRFMGTQEKLAELEHSIADKSIKLHEYEVWYQKDRQEIQILHERLQKKERQIQNIDEQKEYWQEQYKNIQQNIELKQLKEEEDKNKIEQNKNNQKQNIEFKTLNILEQNLQKKSIKLEETQKINDNLRMANKILQKQLIIMGQQLMKLQIQCNELKSQNELLAQQIQQLYTGNVSRSQDERFQLNTDQINYNKFQKNFLSQNQYGQDQQDNIFQRTRNLMMFEDSQGNSNVQNDQLYKIRNLSISSSQSSLMSLKDKTIAKNLQKMFIEQIHETSQEQNTTITTLKNQIHDAPQVFIPKLRFQQQNIKTNKRQFSHSNNTNNFMKKSIIQTLQIQRQSDSKINQLIRKVVLKRISKRLGNKQKASPSPRKGLGQMLTDNSWTDRIVKKRIKRKSPQNKNNLTQSRLISTSREKYGYQSTLIEIQKSQKQKYQKNASHSNLKSIQDKSSMVKSMYISPSNKNTKQPESPQLPQRKSLMNLLVGAVVKNRIKK